MREPQATRPAVCVARGSRAAARVDRGPTARARRRASAPMRSSSPRARSRRSPSRRSSASVAATAVGVDGETYPAALDLFRTRGGVRARLARRCALFLRDAGDRQPAQPRDGRARSSLAAFARSATSSRTMPTRSCASTAASPRPLLAERRARVWHIGSFSKTLCPGLRVGWLVPPPAWRDRATEVKHASDLQASSLGQTMLELFLEHDDFDARLARARGFYRARAARLVRAVRRHLPSGAATTPRAASRCLSRRTSPATIRRCSRRRRATV